MRGVRLGNPRGHLLAEALCALALAGLLAAAAGLALGGARRSLFAAERRATAERAEQETLAILRDALSSADGIILRGDTAVDLDLLVGASVVCDVEPYALLLPPTTVATAPSLTALLQPLGSDDIVSVRVGGPLDAVEWWIGVVDSAQERSMPERCSVDAGWRAAADAGAPLLRLALLDSVPDEVAVGAAVRLAQRGRFTLYRSGDGGWMFGWRRCHPWLDVCGAVQPVAGPLQSPGASGFRIRYLEDPVRYEIRAVGANGGQGASAVIYQ